MSIDTWQEYTPCVLLLYVLGVYERCAVSTLKSGECYGIAFRTDLQDEMSGPRS